MPTAYADYGYGRHPPPLKEFSHVCNHWNYGKVGGALAHTLLSAKQSDPCDRARRRQKPRWTERGCEVAFAEMQDAASLTAAFKGAEGVFILPPSEFDPAPGFPEARAVIAAVKTALESALPAKVVCLSTIGAQAVQSNFAHAAARSWNRRLANCHTTTFLRPAGSWRTAHGCGSCAR